MRYLEEELREQITTCFSELFIQLKKSPDSKVNCDLYSLLKLHICKTIKKRTFSLHIFFKDSDRHFFGFIDTKRPLNAVADKCLNKLFENLSEQEYEELVAKVEKEKLSSLLEPSISTSINKTKTDTL